MIEWFIFFIDIPLDKGNHISEIRWHIIVSLMAIYEIRMEIVESETVSKWNDWN